MNIRYIPPGARVMTEYLIDDDEFNIDMAISQYVASKRTDCTLRDDVMCLKGLISGLLWQPGLDSMTGDMVESISTEYGLIVERLIEKGVL